MSIQEVLTFGQKELDDRYEDLKPRTPVSLIAIGCPQASVAEIRRVAELLLGKKVSNSPDDGSGKPPIWVFTSSANKAIAEKLGLVEIILEAGGLLLENTCPEVVPYDPRWVRHILTNSMKAEHYLQSGLNNIPTSVMRLSDCIAFASGEVSIELYVREDLDSISDSEEVLPKTRNIGSVGHQPSDQGIEVLHAEGLPSQGDFEITAEAFVTDTPITLLGFVNRETGVIEEPGHPADGQGLAGRIAIFPKGTGSTVAPYVLLELFYRGKAPVAVVNTDIDQQTAPACSLEGIPYAFGIDPDVFSQVRTGDQIELNRRGETVTLKRLEQ